MHWHVLRTLHNPKKQPPRNVRIAVLKNFRKFSRALFYFLLLKAFHHAWFPGNSLEFFGTAVLKNTSGQLFLRLSGETVVTVFCSTDAVAQKYLSSYSETIRENSFEQLLLRSSVETVVTVFCSTDSVAQKY